MFNLARSFATLPADSAIQLKELEDLIAEFPDDPDVRQTEADALAGLQAAEAKIEALKTASTHQPVPADSAKSAASEAAPTDKWSKENHLAYHKNLNIASTNDKKPPVSYNVNDMVQAKYMADKEWYSARIVSITGSSVNPIYTVSFVEYGGETQTCRAEHLRPLAKPAPQPGQKRKADGISEHNSSDAPTTNYTPGVISAAAHIDQEKADAVRKEAVKSLDDPKPKRPKKVSKATKALEASKNNWQAWQTKGKAAGGKIAKAATKESMFRTGDAPTAKGEQSPSDVIIPFYTR